MTSRHSPSISLPVILSSIAVTLAVAVLVGWILLIVRNKPLTQDIIANTWLLVAGIVSLAIIIAVLVLFLFFLIREIREVRRQTSFIDSVTHELKSPLAALKLCLETLAREGLPDRQREQLRGMMLDDVDRLSVFIDRVLTATRVSQERAAQTIQEFSLAALAERSVSTIVKRTKVDPAAVNVAIDPALRVATDEIALATALENLIDNAIKYSTPPVRVDVIAGEDARGRLTIDVRDHGIGIPRGHQKRIFERFYRVPEEQVRERRGTGLGLYVVSALIRSLGGRVDASSPGPGEGATVRITLPASRRVS
ncbi:MAG: HAMP domain-containing sensor histidine kinase [Nannocystaceae bacterium]